MVATVWLRLYGSNCMVATAHKLSEGKHRGVWLRSEKILIFSKSMVRGWSQLHVNYRFWGPSLSRSLAFKVRHLTDRFTALHLAWHLSVYLRLDWLIGRSVDWLIDRSVNWLISWSVDWLTGRLIVWSIYWLVDRSTGRLIDWSIDWLVDWLTGWLIDWSIDWLLHNFVNWFLSRHVTPKTDVPCWPFHWRYLNLTTLDPKTVCEITLVLQTTLVWNEWNGGCNVA
jgi:hypothetical protein